MTDIIEEAEKEFIKLLNGKALPTKQLTEVAEHYFIVGYEVATEKMYSEEEVLELLLKSKIETSNLYYEDMKEWLEDLKTKNKNKQ